MALRYRFPDDFLVGENGTRKRSKTASALPTDTHPPRREFGQFTPVSPPLSPPTTVYRAFAAIPPPGSKERVTSTYTRRFFTSTCVFHFRRRGIPGKAYLSLFAEIHTRTAFVAFVIENQLRYIRVHALSFRVCNPYETAFVVSKQTRFIYHSFLRVQRQCFEVRNECRLVSRKSYGFSYFDKPTRHESR